MCEREGYCAAGGRVLAHSAHLGHRKRNLCSHIAWQVAGQRRGLNHSLATRRFGQSASSLVCPAARRALMTATAAKLRELVEARAGDEVDLRISIRDNKTVLPGVGLWRSWERASMAWKRSSVRSRSGPPNNPTCDAKEKSLQKCIDRKRVGRCRSMRRIGGRQFTHERQCGDGYFVWVRRDCHGS